MNTRVNPAADQFNRQLDLSLGLYSNPTSPATMKTYTCRFCKRKFHNSQALGGHQNAHRRERTLIKSYCAFPVNQHSHLFNGTSTAPTANRSEEYERGPGQPEAGVVLSWWGSSSSSPELANFNQCDPDSLDLNLKL
ncbi:putative transcription factor C2H2 family [Helianthus annuus]|nr:putative transcription factor C2H2 family [Helianthus annuus]KAJ0929164.1 putative transcription factor C2H2 family [Helianthus annuus]